MEYGIEETPEDILSEMRHCPSQIKSQIPQSRIDLIYNPPDVHFTDDHREIVQHWAFRLEAALDRSKSDVDATMESMAKALEFVRDFFCDSDKMKSKDISETLHVIDNALSAYQKLSSNFS